MHDRLVSRRIDALHQCFLVYHVRTKYFSLLLIIAANTWICQPGANINSLPLHSREFILRNLPPTPCVVRDNSQ